MNPAAKAGIVLAALAVSVAAGWAITVAVLRLAKAPNVARPRYERDRQGHPVPLLHPDQPTSDASLLLRGGMWIGILERLAVTGAVIAGMPVLIAIVVAVKGLGRYPELKEYAGASERFIIGTLASLTVAVAVGLLATSLMGR